MHTYQRIHKPAHGIAVATVARRSGSESGGELSQARGVSQGEGPPITYNNMYAQ